MGVQRSSSVVGQSKKLNDDFETTQEKEKSVSPIINDDDDSDNLDDLTEE